MIRGLPASIIFHAAIVGLGYVSWPFMVASRDYASESIAVPIDLVDIGALNNIAPVLQPEPEPEPEEEIVPEPEEEEPEEEVPVEEPDPVDETLPEDDIETARDQKAPEEAEPEDVVPDLDAEVEEPEDEPEPKPEPKPEEPKPAVKKPDLLDDFLNTADNTFESERQTRKRQEPPKPRPRLLEDTPPKPQQVRRGAGERSANTARLESLLYNQIYNCWDGVDDQPSPEKLNVRMAIKLDDKGNLEGRIKWLEPTREPLGRSPMRVAMERARRAVQKCAPYNLPRQEYAEWKDININLGPAFEPTPQN